MPTAAPTTSRLLPVRSGDALLSVAVNGITGRLVARLLRLPVGTDTACELAIEHRPDGSEHWTRRCSVGTWSSTLRPSARGRDRTLCERFGPLNLAFDAEGRCDGTTAIVLRLRDVRIGRLAIPANALRIDVGGVVDPTVTRLGVRLPGGVISYEARRAAS